MGSRRFRNVALIGIILFSSIIIFGEENLIFSSISYKKYITNTPEKIKTISFFGKLINGLINAIPGLLIAFIGVFREQKSEKRNLKLQWYNTMILDETVKEIKNYYDFIEDHLELLNQSDEKKKKEIKKLRNKSIFSLDYLRVFDEDIFKECKIHIRSSTDNYIDQNKSKFDIRKKNKELKLETLKMLYNKANEM